MGLTPEKSRGVMTRPSIETRNVPHTSMRTARPTPGPFLVPGNECQECVPGLPDLMQSGDLAAVIRLVPTYVGQGSSKVAGSPSWVSPPLESA